MLCVKCAIVYVCIVRGCDRVLLYIHRCIVRICGEVLCVKRVLLYTGVW